MTAPNNDAAQVRARAVRLVQDILRQTGSGNHAYVSRDDAGTIGALVADYDRLAATAERAEESAAPVLVATPTLSGASAEGNDAVAGAADRARHALAILAPMKRQPTAEFDIAQLAKDVLALEAALLVAQQERGLYRHDVLAPDEVCGCLDETGTRTVRLYERCLRCGCFTESDYAERAEATVTRLKEALERARYRMRSRGIVGEPIEEIDAALADTEQESG